MVASARVVIAHDDELIRDVVALACARRGLEIAADALSFDELVRVCERLTPDVVLTADTLDGSPVEDSLEALTAAKARVIVLSGDPSPDRLCHLLASDVCGYLSLDVAPEELASAIEAVARGEMAVNSAVLSTILYQWRRLRTQPVAFGSRRRPTLTPRELDILTAMSDGLAAKAIAARLGVALKTVENHKIRIFEKLGVKSHAHAVTVAMAYGIAMAPGAGRDPPAASDPNCL